MQFSLVNPPKIFARNTSGRMVQIAGRAGEIGRVENIVVPDDQEIQHLKPFIRYLAKLKSEPFNYGSSSGYRKYPEPPPATEDPIEFDRVDDLPLFKRP